MGEKTEAATPKKLRDAKKKGQVAKSQDLPSAFTFIVSVYVTLWLSEFLYNQLGDFTVSTFKMITNSNLDVVIPQLYYQSAIVIFVASMPIMAVVCVVGVLVNFLTVGPVFALEVFKFDPKKFDPIQNLKAKFKMKTLVELLKSTLKLFIAGYLIYSVMLNSLPVLVKTVSMPMLSALMIFDAFLMEVVAKVGLFFIVIAVLDFLYQKKTFAKEMKMEKFEVKQEYKNTEGDPHIKGKRKQIAQEIAYSDGPSAGVKKAKAIVVNPTHLAIAIGYDRELDAAPYILLMGKDLLAERIIKLAEQYNVPVVQNIKLAHRLWDSGELYQYIPEDTYEALAEILRWVNSLNTDAQYDYIGDR
jgi:type III secretion protein U